MALSNDDQAKIRQYLLGHLSDEEQQKIEERLMLEDDLFEELEISKGELVEDYCAGELTQTEHQWLERNYLASPEGRQRHTFTVALNCIKHPVRSPKRLTWFERLGFFFKSQPWAVAAAAVVLAALIVGVWQSSGSGTSLAVSLNSSVINRSPAENQYREIPLKPGVGEVRITLTLPETTSTEMSYRVELDNRREIKTLRPLAHDGSTVLVVIPARQLPTGFYALRLYETTPEGTEQKVPGDYFFEITN